MAFGPLLPNELIDLVDAASRLGVVNDHRDVIVRPLSTVEYTSVASLFHCRQLSD